MTRKSPVKRTRRGYPPAQLDDHPLLRVLIAEATRRGDTLAAMAGALGVTYERVAQWRRGEANLSKASRRVLEAAATYLQVPTVLVLSMVGTIGLQDFIQPNRIALDDFVQQRLGALRVDPYFAGFVPDALLEAHPSVQHFVTMLYGEVATQDGTMSRNYRWMRALHFAALGNIEAQAELASLGKGGDAGQ